MFTPQNEMGVIVLFTEACESLGWKIITVQQNYPDAIIEDLKTGEQFYAEFEFLASNYIQHKHDPRICDLIVCWENDFHSSLLPVLSLKEMGNGFIFKSVSTIQKVRMHNMLQDGLLSKDKKEIGKPINEDEELQKSIISYTPNGRLVLSTKVIIDSKNVDAVAFIEDMPSSRLSKMVKNILFKELKKRSADYGTMFWVDSEEEEEENLLEENENN